MNIFSEMSNSTNSQYINNTKPNKKQHIWNVNTYRAISATKLSDSVGLNALTHQPDYRPSDVVGQSGEVSDSSLFGVFRAVISRTSHRPSFGPIWHVELEGRQSDSMTNLIGGVLTRKWRAGWAWRTPLKIWQKSFKLTFVDQKWRQIQQLHGLFLA